MGLCPHIHFTPPWPFPPVHVHIPISIIQSNILFTQYILTPVHPLNTTYKIIYLSTLWVGLCPNIPFTPLQPFPLCKMLCHNMIQTIQLHILFQWDQNYFLQSNILFTQYILTQVHPLNTSYIIIYLNTLWVSLCPHTHFTPPWPFPPVQKITSQHNSNYSPKTYYLNGVKIISFSQIYFSLNIF